MRVVPSVRLMEHHNPAEGARLIEVLRRVAAPLVRLMEHQRVDTLFVLVALKRMKEVDPSASPGERYRETLPMAFALSALSTALPVEEQMRRRQQVALHYNSHCLQVRERGNCFEQEMGHSCNHNFCSRDH